MVSGLMREGPEMTNELIKKLRTDGKNPTWYVRLSWLQKRTIPRRPESQESEDAELADIAAPKNANGSRGEESQSAANSEVVTLLRHVTEGTDIGSQGGQDSASGSTEHV